MTDVASHTPSRPHGRRRRDAEFIVYFTLIFLTALPFVSVAWVGEVIRRKTLNLPGPLARAWCEADRITPLIYSA